MYENNLYLFAGTTYNDLWKFNVSTGLWSWIKGPSAFYNTGSYGIQGIENPDNNPGYRSQFPFWVIDSKVYAFNGDMWVYNMASGNWTWLGGLQGQAQVNGTTGVFDTTNNPGGSRIGVSCWTHNGGLYLYGGNTPLNGNYMNDVWKYDTTIRQWAIINNNYSIWASDTIAPASAYGHNWILGDEVYFYGGIQSSYSSESYFMKYNITTNHWQRISDGTFLPVYGTKNIYADSNFPGARSGGGHWVKDGKFYLFGGHNAYNTINNSYDNYFNDLWEYDPSLQKWRWIEGDSMPNRFGVYNNKNATLASSRMGGRSNALFWQNDSLAYFANGSGYCFSGKTYSTDDLWKYNKNTGLWTWLSGKNNASAFRVSYQQNVTNSNNTPANALPLATWRVGDNVYTYYIDDQRWEKTMWKYNVPANSWSLLKVDTGSYRVPGTKGVFANGNWPGKKESATYWVANGKLYLFGGLCFESGMSNELWEFDIVQNNWRWVTGTLTEDKIGHYGTKGQANPANTPPARCSASVVYWNNKSYMFGGASAGSLFETYSDLWEFDHNTGNWTWLHGPNQIEQPRVITDDSLYMYHPLNMPGPRVAAVAWVKDGKIYIYSGYGVYQFYGGNFWEEENIPDFWVYDIATNEWACLQSEGNFPWTSTPRRAVYGTKGIPHPDNRPGARMLAAAFVANDKLWMYSGQGYGAMYTDFGTNDDLWNYDPQTNMWTWVDGHINMDNLPPAYPDQPDVTAANVTPGELVGALGFEWNNMMYIVGGNWEYVNRNQVWRYGLCPQPNTCATQPPTVQLGTDYVICEGQGMELNAGNVGCSFEWSTTDTTQIIFASTAGTYWVNVTDANGQTTSDTIVITSTNAIPSAGIGYNKAGYNVNFYPENPQNCNAYLWDFGDGEMAFGGNVPHTYASTGTYQTRLIVYNQCGSDTISREIEISTTSGIQQPIEKITLKVFPNPTSNQLYVILDKGTIDQIDLYDMQGRLIQRSNYKNKAKEMTINVGTLKAGFYLLQLYSGKEMIAKKVEKH